MLAEYNLFIITVLLLVSIASNFVLEKKNIILYTIWLYFSSIFSGFESLCQNQFGLSSFPSFETFIAEERDARRCDDLSSIMDREN